MPKKTIQDIYVVKKSIRNIKKKDVGKGFSRTEEMSSDEEVFTKVPINKLIIKEYNKDDGEYVENKTHVTKSSLIFLWTVCIISIAVLLFFLSSMFATATLKITPKNQTIALNDAYNITSDKTVSTSTLHFQVMTIKEDLSQTLETDGEQHAEIKATGKAILYNNFSSSDQRLINNTRLETKDGLIYRIQGSVDIPGITTVKGVKTPGSVEVGIIADMPGDKYNMKLSDLKGDFTIPGFEGSTKFTAFYGRLSSDIVGGFVGNVKKVSDEKLSAERINLTNTLKDNLIKEIYSKKPEQYVLFKNNYYVQCSDLPDDSTGDSYKISEECLMNAITFDKDELSYFIAENKIKKFDGSNVDVIWNDSDTVTLQGSTARPWNETSLKAVFSGPAQVVWSFDNDEILNSIVGQDKSVISSIIEKNKNSLTEIQATIRPMWRSTFPDDKNRIKIFDTIRDIN